MGTSTKCTYNQSKQDFTVAVEAGAAIVVTTGQMVAWVGANVDATHQRADINRALRTCADRLKEANWPRNAIVTSAAIVPGAASSTAVFAEGAAPPVLTEDDVAVMYDQDFVVTGGRPFSSELFRGMHSKLVERWAEDNKAA